MQLSISGVIFPFSLQQLLTGELVPYFYCCDSSFGIIPLFFTSVFFIVFESSSMVFLIAASLFELFSRIPEFLQFFENFSSHVLDSFHVTGISPFFLFLEFRSSTSLKFLPPSLV